MKLKHQHQMTKILTGVTEQQAIQQSVLSSSPTMNWPTSTGSPINEFTTEGYISCAFPTLFPTGAADFVAPRQRSVTIGNYCKHLMLYHDQRFAKHPRFRYFALNTVMRHRALQTGRIYVHQNHHDEHLSVDELRHKISSNSGEILSSKVLHFGASLRSTRQFWLKQKSRLTAMVDTLGLSTVFFTHSAADLQWPELARLLGVDDPENSFSRSKAVTENPCLANWFFYHRIIKFINVFYKGILKVSDYWLRFEYQHRGSPHVHGVAWLEDAPDVEKVLASAVEDPSSVQHLIEYINSTVCTVNPVVLSDGSNVSDRRLIHTCVTSHIQRLKIFTRTLNILLPPVRDTLDAQQHIVYELKTEYRNVDLDTLKIFNRKQRL